MLEVLRAIAFQEAHRFDGVEGTLVTALQTAFAIAVILTTLAAAWKLITNGWRFLFGQRATQPADDGDSTANVSTDAALSVEPTNEGVALHKNEDRGENYIKGVLLPLNDKRWDALNRLSIRLTGRPLISVPLFMTVDEENEYQRQARLFRKDLGYLHLLGYRGDANSFALRVREVVSALIAVLIALFVTSIVVSSPALCAVSIIDFLYLTGELPEAPDNDILPLISTQEDEALDITQISCGISGFVLFFSILNVLFWGIDLFVKGFLGIFGAALNIKSLRLFFRKIGM